MTNQRRVREAVEAVDRKHFVPHEFIDAASLDQPLPIGHGQTISQPTTVRMMLGWLDVQPGNRVLDVGSGSGWTSGLLGYLTGPAGHVDAVELVPELVEMGRENCGRLSMTNVTFHQAGEVFGLPEHAPYDRILVSASASTLPPELVEQLSLQGKLVIPVGNTIYEYTKRSDGELDTVEHPGFIFVPLLPRS